MIHCEVYKLDYIEKMLGEPVNRQEWRGINAIPYYLHYSYNYEKATIGKQMCLIITPKGELNTISGIKKNIKRIKEEWNYPIVLEMNSLSRQRKETLIKEKIPFVVNEKQLYLPFMGIALQEKYDTIKNINVEKLSPSSQVLLFLFIYEKNKPLNLRTVQQKLDFKPMRVTRAAAQLVEAGLLEMHTNGTRKVLTSKLTSNELFEKAKPYLLNPVRRKIYINKKDLKTGYFLAGESALAKRTMMSEPQVEVYGIAKVPHNIETMQLIDIDTQCELELWRYDPTKLTGDNCADVLSLSLTLENIKDERVEMSINDMLEKVWKEDI